MQLNTFRDIPGTFSTATTAGYSHSIITFEDVVVLCTQGKKKCTGLHDTVNKPSVCEIWNQAVIAPIATNCQSLSVRNKKAWLILIRKVT